MPPSCALLGEFAIGARVELLWQHNANPSYKLASTPRYDNIVRTRNVSECSVLALCLVLIFRERFAICCRPSVCLSSVCRLSVTFVRLTQAVQIFGNISTALDSLAIH